MPGSSNIHSLLRNKIGLDVESIGKTTVARAIRHRMAAIGMTSMDLYSGKVQVSQQELDELIEQVIVPETWFFRNPESFRFLFHYLSDVRQRFSAQTIRILSVPCASGEEPYSIAMTLIDAGVSKSNFEIDAIDISSLAIKKAEKGLYGENSFRGADSNFRKQYFEETLDGSLLKTYVRRNVKFQRRNLFDMNPEMFGNRYDIIFCRNLLIYLADSAKRRALRTLHDLLNPDGLLFVGHSEAGLPLLPYFRTIRPLKAFVHQKSITRWK